MSHPRPIRPARPRARCFYVNGRFLTQRPTGVQRSAAQWLLALDETLATEGAGDAESWCLLHPPGAAPPPLRRVSTRAVGPRGLPGHVWEQVCLPWAARDGRLISLAGAAPWCAGRQVATLHDAAVFDHPEAYTPAFVGWYRALFGHLARRAGLILTVSQFSRTRLMACLPLAPERLEVLPNGAGHLQLLSADTAVLDRLGLRAGAFLLAVASANPTKNLRRLVQAWQTLPDAWRLPLVLVGGGNSHVFAGPARQPALVASGVVQAGAASDTELLALYQHAALLVMPSVYEGFGLPAVEAMAAGCPVVAGRAGALPEVCGDAAEWVDPFDVAAIAAGLLRVLQDRGHALQLAEAGRRRAALWRWQAAGARLLALVRALDAEPER